MKRTKMKIRRCRLPPPSTMKIPMSMMMKLSKSTTCWTNKINSRTIQPEWLQIMNLRQNWTWPLRIWVMEQKATSRRSLPAVCLRSRKALIKQVIKVLGIILKSSHRVKPRRIRRLWRRRKVPRSWQKYLKIWSKALTKRFQRKW